MWRKGISSRNPEDAEACWAEKRADRMNGARPGSQTTAAHAASEASEAKRIRAS